MERYIDPICSRARMYARVGTTLLAAAVCAVVVQMAGLAATAQAGTAERLQQQERALVGQITRLQARADAADLEIAELEAQQQRAQQQFGEHLAMLYKQTSGSSLLAASSINEIVARSYYTTQLAAYRERLLRIGERAGRQAEDHVAVRDNLVDDLGQLYPQLDRVRRDRSALEAKQSKARAARQAARAAKVDTAPGLATAQLASFTSLQPSPASSSLQGLSLAGQQLIGSTATASSIDLYLQGQGSPMAGQGYWFVLAGSRHGMDPRLVVAIAGAESSFGKKTCGSFNAWGWGCPNKPRQFASWAEGIDSVARGLRRFYLDEGRLSVASIHQKYAPVGAANDPTGLNSSWVQNVSRFLMEQGGNPAYVGAGQSASAPADSGA